MKLIAGFFFVLALSAQTQYRYTCASGEKFDAHFLPPQGAGEGKALLLMADKPPLLLPQVISGSGAKYSDGYTTFWTKGAEALLEYGAVQAKDCRGTPITSPDKLHNGMFVYMADAPTFMDCESGSRVPVAQEKAYLELEKAYTRHKTAPGEPLMVMIEGRVENRPIGENQREVPALIVERFLTAKPGQQCSPGIGPLTGKWNVSVIGEQLVTADRAPFLELREGGAVSGFSGCNRLAGTYNHNGANLNFLGVTSTLMACREPGMGLERQMLKAIGQVKSYKIAGDQLTMLGSSEEIVLRLKRQP